MSQEQYIPARLIPYTKTLAQWTSSNPIPKQGELVGEVASPAGSAPNKMKIGDGVTPYLSLPYVTGGAGTPQSLQDTLNIGFTADSPGNNRIELKNTVGNTVIHIQPTGGNVAINKISGGVIIGMFSATTPFIKISPDLISAFSGQLFSQPLAANRVWGLPDKDGTIAMMSDVTAAGALQGVLNAGNTASQGGGNVGLFILSDTSTLNTSGISANGFEISNLPGKAEYLRDFLRFSIPGFVESNSLGYVVPTGTRKSLLPDEGNGVGLPSTIVLHTTKDTITVNDGSAISAIIHQLGYLLSKEVVSINETRENNMVNYGSIWRFVDTSGSPYTYSHTLLPYLGAGTGAPAGGGATIENWLPQHNGELMTKNKGADSQALIAAGTMIVTHSAPFTPSMVIISATNAAGAVALAKHYISAKTPTTFTITFASPVTATVNIDYLLIP